MRLQILILKVLGWVGAVHLAETEVKILFPSKVSSPNSGGNISSDKTRGQSCPALRNQCYLLKLTRSICTRGAPVLLLASLCATCLLPGLGRLRRDHGQVKKDLCFCSPGSLVAYVQY